MDDHKALRQLRQEIKKKNEESYKENSKKRLINNIDKKFKTTMIGSLAVFEKYFGELWGHGNSNLTPEQKVYKQVWEEARTDILNNGNTQMRIAQEEIAQYTMTWNRYKTEFIVTKDPKKEIENE
tara:strand:- start:696 stop:1070 length:375 start_codon:yes stop_codon:yes gene_type:complete